MEWLASLGDKLKVLFRREQFDRELEEEMQLHQELQAEAHRENGMSAGEAQHAARRQFGNTTRLQEAGWHAWGWAPLERVFQDVRFTVRTLRRAPGFALSVVLLLALAIWMNTTVFTVIHAVMLAPLSFDHSEELVRLYETNPKKGAIDSGVAPANFVDWRTDSRAFEKMAAFAGIEFDTTLGGEAKRVATAFVTADFFSVLRVRPVAGRAFLPEDYAPLRSYSTSVSGKRVAIISYGLWHRRFGGSPAAIGASVPMVDLPGAPVVTVVGVMPADFGAASESLGRAEFLLPMVLAENEAQRFNVIARRRPGISNRQAQAEMDVIARQLQAKRPDSNAGWGVRVADPREAAPGSYRTSLLVLAGAVALVLLIACANVANLMLARGAARRREMATRAAMGAGRLCLVAQLATESVFLSLAAGALGFVLSLASVRAVVVLAPPDLPRIGEISVNPAVFWFCLLVALATGLLCGVAPALRVSKFDLSAALKEGGTASAGGARGLLSQSLVVLEVSVSLVLLVGAGLLARSFASIQTLKFGFQTDHVLAVDLLVARGRTLSYYEDLLRRLQSIPGIEAAASGSVPPGGPMLGSGYYAEGRTEPVPSAVGFPSVQYFQTLSIPLLAGRLFSESDAAGGPPAAIVNRTAARLTWPGEDAIGKRIKLGDPNKGTWVTVVGVVEDVPNRGLKIEPGPQVYLPWAQSPERGGSLLIRTSGDAAAETQAVRAAIRSHDSQTRITRVVTLKERLASGTAGLRFNTLLMNVFAALAFLLAASGVYSLMSYTVTLRTREMSIRMAMGADRADILSLVVRNGAVLVGIGVALGLAGALGAARFVSLLLFQIKARDPLSFVAATALLVLAALAACYVPARRAASLDVVETLRQE
jgi:putative ABC transport system permease protein